MEFRTGRCRPRTAQHSDDGRGPADDGDRQPERNRAPPPEPHPGRPPRRAAARLHLTAARVRHIPPSRPSAPAIARPINPSPDTVGRRRAFFAEPRRPGRQSAFGGCSRVREDDTDAQPPRRTRSAGAARAAGAHRHRRLVSPRRAGPALAHPGPDAQGRPGQRGHAATNARAARSRRRRPTCAPCPASASTPRRRCSPSRSDAAPSCWTRMSGASWPGRPTGRCPAPTSPPSGPTPPNSTGVSAASLPTALRRPSNAIERAAAPPHPTGNHTLIVEGPRLAQSWYATSGTSISSPSRMTAGAA